ncbi:MAG: green heme protein [endosymbiont of Seepiophila jonesi]|uniref:Green heme protein n=1 Tax=endosymbiont of Lamellibrachia luymesi TaxID=2200907 RepID=A0A370DX11_9GAMM|nr:MAG: green heme protein [endosymbiont of Lamellibrachia luymesi]RDH90684.1 MAG: green heme protein [endosymbiont of Seepiophila jonesi]
MLRTLITIASISAAFSATIQAADIKAGKELVNNNCTRCHGSEIYTRKDRMVTTLPGLHKQVRRCEQMLGLTWFDEDVDNAATHLNKQFYKLK